jgi:uncharacterized protein YbjT (DUF2867 family)
LIKVAHDVEEMLAREEGRRRMTTVLVTGATGTVGSSVVRELRGGDASIRAFVRNPAKGAEMLGDDIDLAVGDFTDSSSLDSAMEGVDRVFLASGNRPEQVDHEFAVIDAATAAGVERIVKASTIKAEVGSPLPPCDWHGRIEEYLRSSGVPAVILQSSFYMTNLLASVEQIREGNLIAPAGEGRIAMIDPRDVGAAAAAVIAGEGHNGRTYVLTGPEGINFHEVAKGLSRALGRSVTFVDVPDEAAKQGLVAAGMPDWLIDHLSKLFGIIRQGELEPTTETVRALTGRAPRRFDEFAIDHAALFKG